MYLFIFLFIKYSLKKCDLKKKEAYLDRTLMYLDCCMILLDLKYKIKEMYEIEADLC